MVYLLNYHFLPEDRLAKLMSDLFGLKLVPATIARMSTACAERFRDFADVVREQAENAGRVCRGVELDPLYLDLIIRRYKAATAATAILADTGEPFATVATRRRNGILATRLLDVGLDFCCERSVAGEAGGAVAAP